LALLVDDRVPEGLLERARAGDHRAFAEIVRAHDEGLRMLAYRLLRSRDRMDDVLQEAYIKAYTGLASFRGDARLSTWLYRIVYRACIDDIRRREARPAVPVDDIHLVALPDATAGPAEVTELRLMLADALATLTPEHRAAVLLVDAQGLDYASAAEVLEINRGTLAARLHHARHALRKILGPNATDRTITMEDGQ
jgi:RNA polymerase sigma-70 factor (ECF subfamily)